MTGVTGQPDEPPRRRGRPRNAAHDEAIINATLELLETDGYDRTRVQDIAARAGVGLATLYRRWPTKHDLVIAALEHAGGRVTAAGSPDDPRHDLVAVIEALAREMRGSSKAFLPGLLAAVHSEPTIAAAVRDRVIGVLRARLRDALAAALHEELDPHDIRVDAAPALLLFRQLFDDTTSDSHRQIVNDIVQFLLPASATKRPADEQYEEPLSHGHVTPLLRQR